MATIINCTTGEVITEPLTEQEIVVNAWDSLRYERNIRLSSSDIFVLSDRWSAYTQSKQLEWSLYRQALRDLPQNTTDPLNPVWPVKPE